MAEFLSTFQLCFLYKHVMFISNLVRRCGDYVVFRVVSIYAISTYHHLLWFQMVHAGGVLVTHCAKTLVRNVLQAGGFLQIAWFHPPPNMTI